MCLRREIAHSAESWKKKTRSSVRQSRRNCERFRTLPRRQSCPEGDVTMKRALVVASVMSRRREWPR